MRKLASLVGIVVALGGGYFVYQSYLSHSGLSQTPPQQQIDVIGVRTQLLQMAQAERQYLATHEVYATMEQLQQDGLLTAGTELRGYSFSAAPDGNRGFKITASPSAPDKAGWPTLVVDESLQVTMK